MDASLEAIDAPCTPAFIGDDFSGTAIRPHWQVFETSVRFAQDQDLTATIPMGVGSQVGRLRAVDPITRADKVTVELRTPPTLGATRAALVLENPSSSQIYRLEMDPANTVLRMTTFGQGGSTVTFDPILHVVLGIHHDAGDVVYSAGPDRNNMVEVARANALTALTMHHVAIHVSTSGSGAADQVVWDNVVVTCQ